jgi:hypothetical protein
MTDFLSLPGEIHGVILTMATYGMFPFIGNEQSTLVTSLTLIERDYYNVPEEDRHWSLLTDQGRQNAPDRTRRIQAALCTLRAVEQTCQAMRQLIDWWRLARVLEPFARKRMILCDRPYIHATDYVGDDAADPFYSREYWRLLLLRWVTQLARGTISRYVYCLNVRDADMPLALEQAYRRQRQRGLQQWRASISIDWSKHTRSAAARSETHS